MLVRPATLSDMPYVKSLSKKETNSIGFIPYTACESAVTGVKGGKRWSDVCNDRLWVCVENGDLVGFMMMSYGRSAKCNQICIQEDARKLERGRALLDAGMEHGRRRGKGVFSCGCADDLDSNAFWQAMGWIKVGERKGISYHNTYVETSDRKVNIYRHCDNGLFLPEHFVRKEME